MTERSRTVVLGLSLAVCLVAGSPPRIVGDGGEYLAQVMNFGRFEGPALGRRAIAEIEPRIHALEPALGAWDIEAATKPAGDLRRDFLHFWFYALVTTPTYWLTSAVGLSPLHAFTLTNLALLGAALWVVLPRIGPWPTLLIFGSPLVWWYDKAHTEVFTVALLAIALALWRDRPGVALITAGAAATQNVPIGLVYVLLLGGVVWSTRARCLSDRAFLGAAATGAFLAALHPVYTYVRHGTPSLLLYATRDGAPTTAELVAPILDPLIGWLGNAPLLLVAASVGVFAVAARGRRAMSGWGLHWLTATGAAVWFLFAAAQTSNTHHGATPSLTRYALWLLPLLVPVFAAVRQLDSRAVARLVAALAILSTLTSVYAFHPRVPQNSREPTWLATWLWTRHPTWYNPLPEVFSEPLLGVEGTTVPAATARCEKVLVFVGDSADGVWPIPCYPAALAAPCADRGRACYANRTANGYAFSRVPGREREPLVQGRGAWPPLAEPHVRTVFDRWDWWALTNRTGEVTALRAAHQVNAAVFGDDDQFLVVARPRGAEAALRLRPSGPRLAGELVDALTGERLREMTFGGAPGDLWTIDLPPNRPVLIVGLTRGTVPQ